MSVEHNVKKINSEIAKKSVLYSMMACNSYHNADRLYFDLSTLGWKQLTSDGMPVSMTKPNSKYNASTPPTVSYSSGLAYDIYEQENTNNIIIAYRGTDEKKDYLTANFSVPPFNTQYKQAISDFESYINKNPDKNIVVTGHSLGGGLALCISVRFGIKAFVFDSSPRIFDGIENKNEPAERYSIFESGEVLSYIRGIWIKYLNIVPQENIYRCDFRFGSTFEQHRSDYLALGLLKLSIHDEPSLKLIYDNLDKSIIDYIIA
ncbi:YqiA/YcfP family alpha/beta fold hydrolase [Aeromonas sp. 604443]|uniref:YqiA/YcfP family alpha/beta fold hydrolase n=1 Tax=Aeromonas sp. 604443 TaxID=2712054 RepID=UPI003B9E2C96